MYKENFDCGLMLNGSYVNPYYVDTGLRITELEAFTEDYDLYNGSYHTVPTIDAFEQE
jgi:hypothetical protein